MPSQPLAAPTHRRVAGGKKHPQNEGSKEGATDDSHDGEGALQERVGDRELRAEPSHLSWLQFACWESKT